MELSTYLSLIGIHFIRHLPVLLIGAIGLRFAVPLRKQIGRAAIWASYGFALLIIHSIARVAGDVMSIAIRIILIARAFFLDRDEVSGQPLTGVEVVSGTA